MGAHRLASRHVERIWGRRDLPAAFAPAVAGAEPVGEIWFEDDSDADSELLVKYLFTSERLSVQVHPDDAAARARGYKRGKDEAWYILDAEPGATIGLGLTREVAPEALRAAALDGSIETLLDWRPARAGDVFYSPAGTVHAIGPGLSLIEIQQNLDLTYRLYDYGRPREIHLEDALAVAHPAPWAPPFEPREIAAGRNILAAGKAFVLERWTAPAAGSVRPAAGRPAILIVVRGDGAVEGRAVEPGSVWIVDGPARVRLDQTAELLVAYPGPDVAFDLIA